MDWRELMLKTLWLILFVSTDGNAKPMQNTLKLSQIILKWPFVQLLINTTCLWQLSHRHKCLVSISYDLLKKIWRSLLLVQKDWSDMNKSKLFQAESAFKSYFKESVSWCTNVNHKWEKFNLPTVRLIFA